MQICDLVERLADFDEMLHAEVEVRSPDGAVIGYATIGSVIRHEPDGAEPFVALVVELPPRDL